jgi:hypothetical protein
MKKPTDIEIAKSYDVTDATLRNYKKGSGGKKRLYRAMKYYYDLPEYCQKEISELNRAELFKLHEYLVENIQSSIDTLQVISDFIYDKN